MGPMRALSRLCEGTIEAANSPLKNSRPANVELCVTLWRTGSRFATAFVRMHSYCGQGAFDEEGSRK